MKQLYVLQQIETETDGHCILAVADTVDKLKDYLVLNEQGLDIPAIGYQDFSKSFGGYTTPVYDWDNTNGPCYFSIEVVLYL